MEELERRGLAILERNLRVGRLELDIVARDGAVVVVVEVRLRGPGAWVRPLDSVDPAKRARVRRAGELLWSQRFAADPDIERMRFDIAGVIFEGDGVKVEIVRSAF